MRSGYELFSIGDVKVKIHGSFIVLGVLMVLWALAEGGSSTDVGYRILGPFILFATVILHELGHATVARLMGVRVIDVILTPMGGMARIEGELRDPKEEGYIAVAGPATNLLLAILAFAVIAALGRTNEIVFERIVFFLEERRSFLQDELLIVVFGLNVLLTVLNLIPVFPCDGGRVLRAILSARVGRLRGTRITCKIGLYVGFALILMPLFVAGQQWWITPFAGIYFLFASLKERLSVEAREGLGLTGGFFRFGQGFGSRPQDSFDAGPRPVDATSNHDQLADGDVIDVTGSSRILDETDD